jgi:hypothetical protein
MTRRGLWVSLSVGVLTLVMVSRTAEAEPRVLAPSPASAVIEAQWPGWQGGWQGGSPGYGQDWEGRREHCWRLRDRLREIRYRMYYASPWERDQIEHRVFNIRERLRHECWGQWREDEE